MKRPDMRPYFNARIDQHVNGMMARTSARLPAGVVSVQGDVDDTTITAVMRDGTEWRWHGGQYATRKVAGCYAPKMPKPVKPFTGFICKRCGAESPTGIGYAATRAEVDTPAADCPNPHTEGV